MDVSLLVWVDECKQQFRKSRFLFLSIMMRPGYRLAPREQRVKRHLFLINAAGVKVEQGGSQVGFEVRLLLAQNGGGGERGRVQIAQQIVQRPGLQMLVFDFFQLVTGVD